MALLDMQELPNHLSFSVRMAPNLTQPPDILAPKDFYYVGYYITKADNVEDCAVN